MSSDRYDINISFEADGSPQEIADILTATFGDHPPLTASANAISRDEGRVVVHFWEVADQVPAGGANYTPPRSESPTEAIGRRAIENLDKIEGEPAALVPIVRALVAMSAARQEAGLSPRQRISIEVEPAPVHRQEELRHG